jgi:hypothetical protein
VRRMPRCESASFDVPGAGSDMTKPQFNVIQT